MRSLVLLSLVFLVNAVPLSWRDLAGLFDGGDNPDQSITDLGLPPETTLSAITEPSLAASTTRIKTATHTSRSITTTTTGNSAITGITQLSSTTTMGFSTTLMGTASGAMSTTIAPTPIVPEAPITSAEEATQWKVIGIGIITVGLIATVILSIIFFDSWWNFLCDLLCGRWRKHGKNQGEENMIPDWETRDWEFRLANEDGHRYPTMSSLADITEGRKAPKELKLVPISDGARLSSKAPYLLDLDLAQNPSGESLTRKSSTR